MEARNGRSKTYFVLYAGFFASLFVALAGQVAWLQTVDGAFLKRRQRSSRTRDNIITSKRGTIYDRNNKELAVSASVEMVTVSPNEIKSRRQRAGGEKTRRNFVAEL